MTDAGDSKDEGMAGELAQLRRANARLQAELGRRQQEAAALEIGRAALQTSERRLRDTLESTDAGFLLIDHHWSVIDLNRRAAQITGQPAARIIGRSVFDLWPGEGGEHLATVLRRTMTQREPETVLHHQASGAQASWFDVQVFPAAQGLTLFFRDVTAHQAALAESEQRSRAIAEALPGIVFVTDAAGANTYVNPQFSAFVGRPVETLLGFGWLDVVHPDDQPQSLDRWQEFVRREASFEVEQRFRRADGVYRWFLCRGVPVREPAAAGTTGAGRVVQWFGTATDIQDLIEARELLAADRAALEQRVAERTQALQTTLERLRHEEARLRAIFEHSSECMFLLRVDRERGPVFLDVNPPAEAMLGQARASVVGMAPQDLSGDPADRQARDADLQAALRPGAGPHRYLARRHYNGQERLFDAVAVALDGPQGERLILVTARDITDRRTLEEALRQSSKMEAIGQLTGGIAHDFNNLLTGMSGSLELIRARVAQGRAGEVDRYALAALESVRRGATLTHRLLAFARRQALDPQTLDLNRLVTAMQELIGRTVGAGVSIETVLAPDLWPTLCDANQLENALLNLCLNARDAMPQGGRMRIVTANVSADPTAGGARTDAVSLSVVDSGIGMPPEVASHAFEPFFTTKPAGQGTGLGLAMVYGFVRQSGGQISLQSEVGRGTEIRIELPRCTNAALPAPGDTSIPRPGATLQAAQTILLVQNEPLVRGLAAEALNGLGYQVVQAGDAGAAMRLLQNGANVNLLMTDVVLPGMSGQELVESARALRPTLKVLFVTSFAHEAGAEVGLIGPDTALLAKPIGLATLARKVEAVLAS